MFLWRRAYVMAKGSSGSWPCDNALEESPAGRERAVALRSDRCEHFFPIWTSMQPGGSGHRVRPPTLRRLQSGAAYAAAPIAAIRGRMPTMFSTRVRL